MSEPRVTQPLCQTCKHPRSFHGGAGPCKALGCQTCTAYVSPGAKTPEEVPAK